MLNIVAFARNKSACPATLFCKPSYPAPNCCLAGAKLPHRITDTALALFGAAGYGQRIGWLNAPARVLQAAAPLIFGAALAVWGVQAIWLTAGIGILSTVALFMLRRT